MIYIAMANGTVHAGELVRKWVLLAGLMFPSLAAAQFVGPIQSTTYEGCSVGRAACFRSTYTFGNIVPLTLLGRTATTGFTLTFDQQWNERGFVGTPGVTRPYAYNGGSSLIYEDYGGWPLCFNIVTTCGPSDRWLNAGFTQGIMPIFNGTQPPVPTSFQVNFVGPSTSGQFLYEVTRTEQVTLTAVPEPSTYPLMVAGLVGVAFMARRRNGAK